MKMVILLIVIDCLRTFLVFVVPLNTFFLQIQRQYLFVNYDVSVTWSIQKYVQIAVVPKIYPVCRKIEKMLEMIENQSLILAFSLQDDFENVFWYHMGYIFITTTIYYYLSIIIIYFWCKTNILDLFDQFSRTINEKLLLFSSPKSIEGMVKNKIQNVAESCLEKGI